MQKNEGINKEIEKDRKKQEQEYEKSREKSEREYLRKNIVKLGFKYLELWEYDVNHPLENKDYHDEVREFIRELKKKIDECAISDKKQKINEILEKSYILNTVYEYLNEDYSRKLVDREKYGLDLKILLSQTEIIKNYTIEDFRNVKKINEIFIFLKTLENIDGNRYVKETIKIEIIGFFLRMISTELYNFSIERSNFMDAVKDIYTVLFESLKKRYPKVAVKKERIKNRLSIEEEFSLFLLQKIREKPNFYKNSYRIKEVYKKQPRLEEKEIYKKILKKEKITNFEIEVLLLYIREDIKKSEVRIFEGRINFIMEFIEEMKRFNSILEIENIQVFKSIYTVLYVENSNYERKSNYKLAKEILENKDLEFKFLDEIEDINTEEIQKNKRTQNKINEYASYLVSTIQNTTELYYSTEEELQKIIELDKAKVKLLEEILELPNRGDIIKNMYNVYTIITNYNNYIIEELV